MIIKTGNNDKKDMIDKSELIESEWWCVLLEAGVWWGSQEEGAKEDGDFWTWTTTSVRLDGRLSGSPL